MCVMAVSERSSWPHSVRCRSHIPKHFTTQYSYMSTRYNR